MISEDTTNPSAMIPNGLYRKQRLLIGGLCMIIASLVGMILTVFPSTSSRCTMANGATSTKFGKDRGSLVFALNSNEDGMNITDADGDEGDDSNESSASMSVIPKKAKVFDFAIVGYPKCATTFLHTYFQNRVPQVYMPRKELCDLFHENTTHHDLISRFYHPYEMCGKDVSCGIAESKTPFDRMEKLYWQKADQIAQAKVSGFKCPRILETEFSLPYMAPFLSKMNLILQVRHPVLWFESYWNYRSKERYPEELLSPNKLVGTCDKEHDPYIVKGGIKHKRNVCTDRSKFHHSLARLGLTPMSSSKEKSMLNPDMSVHPIDGKVFLLEVGQLSTDNKTRTDAFRNELQEFLGLQDELPPFPGHSKASSSKSSKAKQINICDKEHAKAHDELMKNGIEAATWIREYFLQSPRVHVTSKEFFLELLEQWKKDPCKERSVDKKQESRN